MLLLLLVSEAPRPVQLSMGSGMSLGSVEWEPELKPVAGCGPCHLGAARVGAEQHLVTGSSLCPASPLLTQEFLEPVGGEGECLAAQLHQVGILQPWVGQAVL